MKVLSLRVGIPSSLAVTMALTAAVGQAQLVCDMSGYKAQKGLAATGSADTLTMTWSGDNNGEVRLAIAVRGGTPVIQELALKKAGAWTVLANNAKPEYTVVTGLRRMSNQQMEPLRGLGVALTQDVLNKYRWDPFWDAPLDLSKPRPQTGAVPTGNPPPNDGGAGTDQPGLPRDPNEIQRASAEYAITVCSVKSDGARLVADFPGVKLGLFEGSLRFTVFRGSNLIKQEVVATTHAPWVAYKYDSGWSGMPIKSDSRVVWRDTSNTWQQYAFGGISGKDEVPVAANNRLLVAEQGRAGSIAAFPPPHKFFWSREVAANMGYDWYRKDSDNTYSFGIRQNEHEELSEGQANWALYSARPGTEQLMTLFLYPSLADADQTAAKVLEFTHGDRYKPLPGYQVMQHHYHMDLGARLLAQGSTSYLLPDLQAIKSLGINIVSQIDSVMIREGGPSAPGGGSARAAAAAGANAPRPDQLAITAASIQGARLASDKGFLVMADQEVYGSPLGGHTDLLFSHPVYWDQRRAGQPLTEISPQYGKVYHVGSAEDFMQMVDTENVMISMPHPRTKGSTGFPDAVKDKTFFDDPHYTGVGLRWGMGLDGSEKRTCEYRCLPLLDDLSNWIVDRPEPLKVGIAISEVRHQTPGDDLYASSPVTYVHLKDLPPPTDPSPVIATLMRGDMFMTTGEVLVTNFAVKGSGDKRTVVADVEWTFPLDMVEIVYGDGKTTQRKVVPATDLPAFGTHHFEIPFDATGQKWVRFAAWDAAYEGAFLEPQRLGPTPVR